MCDINFLSYFVADLDITPRKKKLIRKLGKSKQKIKLLRVGNVMDNIDSVALKGLKRAYIRNNGKNHKENGGQQSKKL